MNKLAIAGVFAFFLMFSLDTSAEATFFGEAKTGFQEITTDRYGASFFVPPSFNAQQDWPLVIVLYSDEVHKGADFVKNWVEDFKTRNTIALFVSYLEPRESPYDSDKRLFRLMDEFQKMYPVDQKRILLTAFGGAAHYAFYLGFRYPERFSAVALIGGGTEGRFERFFSYDNSQSKKLPFLVLYGTKDTAIEKEKFVAHHLEWSARGYQIDVQEMKGLDRTLRPEFKTKIMDWFVSLPAAVETGVKQTEKNPASLPFGIPRFVSNLLRGIAKN